MEKLELQDWPSHLSGETLRTLYKKVLFHPHMVRPNTICYWLGRGTFKTAVDHVILNNAEITNTTLNKSWLEQKPGINSVSRQNEFNKYISRDLLDQDDLAYISSITSEDLQFYSYVADILARKEANSIMGTELAEPTRNDPNLDRPAEDGLNGR